MGLKLKKNDWIWIGVAIAIVFLIIIIVCCTCTEDFGNNKNKIKIDDIKKAKDNVLNGNLNKFQNLWMAHEKKKDPKKTDEELKKDMERKD